MKSSHFRIVAIALLVAAGFSVGVWHTRRSIMEPDLPGAPRLAVPAPSASAAHGMPGAIGPAGHGAPEAKGKGASSVTLRDPRDLRAAEARLRALAIKDPLLALKEAQALPAWMQVRATEVVLAAWASTKPDEAFAYIKDNNPDFLASTDFIKALIDAGRPDLAVSSINLLQDSSERNMLVPPLFATWANADPAGFAKWMAQLPEVLQPAAHAALVAQGIVAGAISSADIVSMLGTNPAAWTTAAGLLTQSGHYAEAKAYFSQIAVQPYMENAIANLAQNAPPADMASWLDKITNPSTRRSAVGIDYQLALSQGSPAVAAQLATDPTLFDAVKNGVRTADGQVFHPSAAMIVARLSQVVQVWAVTDPAAATAFVKSSQLD